VREAEAADDATALANACFVIAKAYGELGKDGADLLMRRSLEAYQRSGNVEKQADVLSKMGVVCQWEGHWDEALSHHKRAREAAQKVGGTVSAAISSIHIAEIMIDRGEWTDAEALLAETLPLLRASQYRYYFAHCLVQFGRVAFHTHRLNEALRRFEDANATYAHVGSERDIPLVDTWIGECRVAMGEPDAALEVVRRLVSNADKSRGLNRVMARLRRVQAHALLRQGDYWGARESLEASLALAKEHHNLFETAITMLSLIELDRLEGVEPDLAMVTDSHSLLSKLKIRAVPSVPAPAP
jgi:ATP/maltotriose-dependent transcriptional regulator MalT